MTDYSELKVRMAGHSERSDTKCVFDVSEVTALLKDLEVATSVGKALGVTLASVVEGRDALVLAVADLRAENKALREDLEHARRQPLYSTRLAAERYRLIRAEGFRHIDTDEWSGEAEACDKFVDERYPHD